MSDWTDDADAPPPGDFGGSAGGGLTLSELVAKTDDLCAETEEVLDRLDAAERSVQGLVEYLQEAPAGGAWCWRYLDPYETQALFIELRDWVDWMVVRYNVDEYVRPCWFRHGVAIEELTALYVAWRSTYKEKPRAYSDDLTAFHDRWFWHALERLKTYRVFKSCTPIQHVDDNEQLTTRSEDFDPFTASLVAHVTAGADADTVHAAIDAGDADPLDPKDPTSPVRWNGTWWAILANSPNGLWVPRPAHVCAAFEDLFAKLHPPKPAEGQRN